MKESIHPEYGPAVIRCGCGNSWETQSTMPEMRIEVCHVCHPYFTGEQRIVDTAGRVERFRRRYGLSETAAMADVAAADADAPDAQEADAAEPGVEEASAGG